MSIGGFIDSITNTATLVVVPEYKKDRYTYTPSSVQLFISAPSPTATYTNGAPSVAFNNSLATTFTLNQQDDPDLYYNVYTLDIIPNRTSIYISNSENYPHGNSNYFSSSVASNFTSYEVDTGNFQQVTSSYKIKHKDSSTNIYIQNSVDDLTIQYNVLSDEVSQVSPLSSSSEGENGNGGNNNNNQSSLKEFWA